MGRRARAVAAAAALALALTGCSGEPAGSAVTGSAPAKTPVPTAAASRLLDPPAFRSAIADPAGITVINVHVPFEGSIAGTGLSIPFDQIRQQAAQLPADRARPLAVYCRTGRMSAVAVATLAELGYTDVVELDGGMLAWQASGYPLTGV